MGDGTDNPYTKEPDSRARPLMLGKPAMSKDRDREAAERLADAVIAYYNEWWSEGMELRTPGFFRNGLIRAMERTGALAAAREERDREHTEALGFKGNSWDPDTLAASVACVRTAHSSGAHQRGLIEGRWEGLEKAAKECDENDADEQRLAELFRSIAPDGEEWEDG